MTRNARRRTWGRCGLLRWSGRANGRRSHGFFDRTVVKEDQTVGLRVSNGRGRGAGTFQTASITNVAAWVEVAQLAAIKTYPADGTTIPTVGYVFTTKDKRLTSICVVLRVSLGREKRVLMFQPETLATVPYLCPPANIPEHEDRHV